MCVLITVKHVRDATYQPSVDADMGQSAADRCVAPAKSCINTDSEQRQPTESTAQLAHHGLTGTQQVQHQLLRERNDNAILRTVELADNDVRLHRQLCRQETSTNNAY